MRFNYATKKMTNYQYQRNMLIGMNATLLVIIRALAKVELSKILKEDRVYRHQQELGLKSQIINSRDDIESKM